MNVFESRSKEIDSMMDRVMVDLKEEMFETILGMIAKAAVTVATTSKISVGVTKNQLRKNRKILFIIISVHVIKTTHHLMLN